VTSSWRVLLPNLEQDLPHEEHRLRRTRHCGRRGRSM
jgi:hypothetical protein